MDFFNYHNDQLFAEDCAITDLAKHYGTPFYVYSRATLERHWRAFDQAFGDYPHTICYSVKANSNLALLNCLARLGSGFDVVSIGELERVLTAGGDPSRIVFSGVGKQAHEMRRALEVGIASFNVESSAELTLLNQVAAEVGAKAPVALRINPDVDPKTHPYISTGLKENKFGIDIETAKALYFAHQDYPHVEMIGIDCHIGSQLTELSPFLAALDHVLELCDELAEHGITISMLDLGGGLGVRYSDEEPPHPEDHIAAIKSRLNDRQLRVVLEPGRAIAANAGLLVTQVLYTKTQTDKHFAIVDAAMNDLLRPALYQAWQQIIPVDLSNKHPCLPYDVVGPICETGDFLGKDRELAIGQGDLLAIRSAGAYSFTMSSNYNSRPRVAEVMVDGDQHYCVRQRETIDSLFANEAMLP